MKFSLPQIEAFFWVARLGSVSAAARHLNVSQPTISLRLRDLSFAIGSPVAVREGKRMRLTSTGWAILDEARLIIAQAEKIHDRAQPRTVAGVVRLGMSEAVALAALPRMLDRLGREHPSLRLELAIETSETLMKELFDGTIDLSIGINLTVDPRLRTIPFGLQEASWAAPPDLQLPAVLRPADLAHLPILTNPAPSPAHRQTWNWFASAGLEPRQILVSNSVSVIAHLVSAGVGMAILPRRLVGDASARGAISLRPCRPDLEHSILSAAYRSSDLRSTIGAVVNVARAVLAEMEWLVPTEAREDHHL